MWIFIVHKSEKASLFDTLFHSTCLIPCVYVAVYILLNSDNLYVWYDSCTLWILLYYSLYYIKWNLNSTNCTVHVYCSNWICLYITSYCITHRSDIIYVILFANCLKH